MPHQIAPRARAPVLMQRYPAGFFALIGHQDTGVRVRCWCGMPLPARYVTAFDDSHRSRIASMAVARPQLEPDAAFGAGGAKAGLHDRGVHAAHDGEVAKR